MTPGGGSHGEPQEGKERGKEEVTEAEFKKKQTISVDVNLL